MNREETKAAIAVMQAYVDGKEIQHQPTAAHIGWETCDNRAGLPPCWQWNSYKYRVKPQAIRYRPYLYNMEPKICRVYNANTKEEEAAVARAPYFVRWLGEWQEVEV